MTSIALIPARGGSKRLPRKNILPFLGKPLIAYSIEAALESTLFARVVVSTDDDEIAAIAKSHGAEIYMRKADLATDKATVSAVALDFLNAQNAAPDILCVLYATAPLRTADDIRATHALIKPGTCHHALAVTEYDLAPHQALKVTSENGDLSPMWPEIVDARADSLPKMVVDNGSTYCVVAKDFKQIPKFYNASMRGHFMPKWKSVDMDTADDFELAEFYARKNGLEKHRRSA